ncbi:hypothetical protein VIBHAR_01695 [Vibrio campbellii ATCC BAA-1116]|uniref:Uncharacterized protein n=1 Tax=Vibrio campbellii (strain ATCC BAA-1116) TaxID=2902295 RepID=A7MTF9_VIBC1|nr:hypothetical protein VIBHAR_01695 [Vibrio campbellii ATCC BAA-1116]
MVTWHTSISTDVLTGAIYSSKATHPYSTAWEELAKPPFEELV